MKRALVALVMVVGLVAGPGGAETSAWAVRHKTGHAWGGATLPRVQYWVEVQLLPCTLPDNTPSVCPVHYLNVMTTGRVTVRRAPVRGVQTVALQFVVQKWGTNGWTTVTTSRYFFGRIGRHQRSVQFGQWNVRPNAPTRGYWRLVYLVSWANSRGAIGTRAIGPSHDGEQYCGMPVMTCTDYGAYLYVDRLG
jgi:hypothetical protein